MLREKSEREKEGRVGEWYNGTKKNGVRWSRHPSYNFGGSAERNVRGWVTGDRRPIFQTIGRMKINTFESDQ